MDLSGFHPITLHRPRFDAAFCGGRVNPSKERRATSIRSDTLQLISDDLGSHSIWVLHDDVVLTNRTSLMHWSEIGRGAALRPSDSDSFWGAPRC